MLVVQESVNDEVSLVSNSEETQTAGCNQSKDNGQGQNVNEDDDDNNDSGSGDESDDMNDDMDDFYLASKPRKVVKDVKKHISLPVILTLIDPDLDVMQLTRLLMCQVILCHSNSKARAAVSSKQYIDFAIKGQNFDFQKYISGFYLHLANFRILMLGFNDFYMIFAILKWHAQTDIFFY